MAFRDDSGDGFMTAQINLRTTIQCRPPLRVRPLANRSRNLASGVSRSRIVSPKSWQTGGANKKTPKETPEDLTAMDQAKTRRATLKKLGRFAPVTAPTVTLLLAAQTKPGRAVPPSPCK
jgi:hypothetical protein